jgi:hypothetical protein
MHRLVSILCLALVTLLPLACGGSAPASEPATGPIGEQVEQARSSGRGTFDHSAWDRLLREGTRNGLVDYDYMTRHRADLDGYLEAVAGQELSALSGPELKALLMNAYNALTVRSILDNQPVESIRDIDGVWKEATHTVGGQEVTLDAIEHNLLRPYWKDPRIHFGVNCASMSCAPLPPWAFTGSEVDRQLDERARAFLSSRDNVRIEGGRLLVSKYFEWYGDDFTAAGWEPRADTIPGFIARYTRPEVSSFLEENETPELEFMDYDWSLNAAG